MKEILIYGPIGQATTAADVVRQFQDAEDEEVLLRIHSEGGSVLDGYAMLSAIKRHKRKVYAHVEGMAFSMAAVISLELRDTLSMAKDAWIMFHEVRNYAGGTEEDLERQLEQMRLMNQAIVTQLSEALGISEEEAAEQLKNEIWMNGQQAFEAGLVAELLPEAALAAYADPEKHQNAPQEFFAQSRNPESQPTTEMKLFKLFKRIRSLLLQFFKLFKRLLWWFNFVYHFYLFVILLSIASASFLVRPSFFILFCILNSLLPPGKLAQLTEGPTIKEGG